MREKRIVWMIGLVLNAIMVVGIASCAKEDVPQPPTPVKPDTPAPIIPVADSSKEPFDPNKPYKPVNKILQVFKYGYPKIKLWSMNSSDPVVTEYITDENNNLVRILINGRPEADFEYGEYFDNLGNRYHIKYTKHYWAEINGEYTQDIIDYLLKLNEDEMIEDRFEPIGENGYHFEYANGHLVKTSHYYIKDGQRIEDRVLDEHKWNSNTLITHIAYNISGKPTSYPLEYPSKDLLIENRGSLFGLINPTNDCGINNDYYMAALLGHPSQYIPSAYRAQLYLTDLKLDANGLPESVECKEVYPNSTESLYEVKYVWRYIIW